MLAVHRAPPAPAFDAAAISRLQDLVGPLERTLRLRERLESRESDGATAVLDRFSTAVVAIDPDGRVRYANLRARRVLQRADGLSLRRDRLHLQDPEAAARLQASLEAARRGERTDAVLVPRGGGRHAYVAVVTGGGAGAPSGVLVLLYAASDSAPAPDRLLQQLFGMTSAEAELAKLMIAGATPQEAAGRRGVRIATVRTQIKSILTKTGARRLTEAVALLCTLAPLAPLD